MAEKLNRYVQIILKLRRAGESGVPFHEIQQFIFMNSGTMDEEDKISQRTFQRYIITIYDSFGIKIVCNGFGHYYIKNENSDQKLSVRLLETIHLYNLPSVDGTLHGRIQIDERPLKGKELIPEIIYSLRENRKVRFVYRKFSDNSYTERELEPYGLKEFNNRWYLVGKDTDKRIKVFGLDRMESFRIAPERFSFPVGFNLPDYFRDCFGITRINTSKGPETIVLEFTTFTGKYVKTCPLHSSQEILEDTDKQLKIRLKLHITHEFIAEMRAYGDDVKIVSPVSLRRSVQLKHRRIQI